MHPFSCLVFLLLVWSGSSDADVDYEFPEDFLFGTATAAYQIEGAWNVNGKGENIWDRATHTNSGLIEDNTSGDVACNSYYKYKEDIALVKSLGVSMYRFSFMWSRILPTGAIDKINEDGLRYYTELIDECIRNGLQPMATIYHWDLPQPLQDFGGWVNDDMVHYFEDYANLLFSTFGSKIKYWLTFNELGTFCYKGYGNGLDAPGVRADGLGDYMCAHTVLKAHARVYHLYHDKYNSDKTGQLSMTCVSFHFEPYNATDPADVAAADRAYQFFLGICAHPIFSKDGDYPEVVKKLVAQRSKNEGLSRSRLPIFTEDEKKMIKGSADFFALNHYSTKLVIPLDPINATERSREHDSLANAFLDPNLPEITPKWMKVVPWGFRKLLVWIRDHYDNPKVFVTENGVGDAGDTLRDTLRTGYYRSYLQELLKAVYEDKCNVIGYTAWSLMDNFEWTYGYKHRYGLHYVDFTDPNLARIPKMSAKFFQIVTKTRKLPSDSEIDFPDGTIPTHTPSGGQGSNTAPWPVLVLLCMAYVLSIFKF